LKINTFIYYPEERLKLEGEGLTIQDFVVNLPKLINQINK
jgi:hypothetical protein